MNSAAKRTSNFHVDWVELLSSRFASWTGAMPAANAVLVGNGRVSTPLTIQGCVLARRSSSTSSSAREHALPVL